MGIFMGFKWVNINEVISYYYYIISKLCKIWGLSLSFNVICTYAKLISEIFLSVSLETLNRRIKKRIYLKILLLLNILIISSFFLFKW